MIDLIYSSFLSLISGIGWLFSPFNSKLKRILYGQKNSKKWLKDNQTRYDYWFHCASLGEYEMIVPLAKRIKEEFPKSLLVISFFSPSGFENVSNPDLFEHKFYLPLDTRKNAKKTIESLGVKKVFWVKYDFWIQHLSAIKKSGCDLYLINAHVEWNSTKGNFYRRLVLKPSLKNFDLIFQMYETGKPWFPKNTITTGDTKFDRTWHIAQEPFEHLQIENFSNDWPIIIGGSTYEEEEILLHQLLQKYPKLKAIIAPHSVTQDRIRFIEKLFVNETTILLSKVSTKTEARILIVDSIGLLSKIYKYGTLAIVGGGWAKGLHNILEASAHGLPVFFGPNRKNQKESQMLIEEQVAFETSSKHFTEKATFLLERKNEINRIKEKTSSIFEKQRGSVELVFQNVFNN